VSYQRRQGSRRQSHVLEETEVNKDQVKGSAKQIAGKAQEKAGKLLKNRKQQVKGTAKQAAGKVQKAYGDARDDLGDQDEETRGRG
jgi:uncharacterized protein YjbJ (UPF0337 family)